MRLRHLAATVLLSIGSVSALAQASSASPAATPGPGTLNVVVTQGKDGKPIPGLTQSNFTVLDNGAAQSITSFRAVSGQAQPVKVLIVIDAVNLDFQHIAYEREQLDRFLKANGGKLAQPTAMAIVTDTGTQIQPTYTTDGNALSGVLDKQVIGLRELRRSSGFYGAEERLDLSIKAAYQLVARTASEPGRKFMIWASPGWPLLSGPGVEYSNKDQQRIFGQVVDFSEALRRSNTTMYVVDPLGAAESPARTFYYEEFVKGVRKPSQAVLGDLGAQVLAVQSGGLFLSGNNDLSILLQRCFADASAYYEIAYQPPPAEKVDEYHRIEIRMAEPNQVGRTRQGYYAQPAGGAQPADGAQR